MSINPKKIIIVGDAGRGKTTFAGRLSEILRIPHYSTDDFYWKVKYSEPAEKSESIKAICELYQGESWIVEGTTRHLISPGFEEADVIFHLIYPNIFAQWWVIIKRSMGRKDEGVLDTLKLLKHVFLKRYGLGTQKKKVGIKELLKPYTQKVVALSSFREIDSYLRGLESE